MKKTILVTLALFLIVFSLCVLPIHGEAGIYDNVIRLHVLANSDSEEDQALKLTVRDAILAESEEILAGATTREEAEAALSRSLPRIERAARKAVRAAGFDAPISVCFDVEQYPTRQYENLAFPAGKYLSLRVKIGEAEGRNWWCVLFPPLCVGAATGRDKQETVCLAAGLSTEQYRLIADTDSVRYKLRFKILETIAGRQSAFS